MRTLSSEFVRTESGRLRSSVSGNTRCRSWIRRAQSKKGECFEEEVMPIKRLISPTQMLHCECVCVFSCPGACAQLWYTSLSEGRPLLGGFTPRGNPPRPQKHFSHLSPASARWKPVRRSWKDEAYRNLRLSLLSACPSAPAVLHKQKPLCWWALSISVPHIHRFVLFIDIN